MIHGLHSAVAGVIDIMESIGLLRSTSTRLFPVESDTPFFVSIPARELYDLAHSRAARRNEADICSRRETVPPAQWGYFRYLTIFKFEEA
jgi:hypothetical protein